MEMSEVAQYYKIPSTRKLLIGVKGNEVENRQTQVEATSVG